MWKGRLHCNLQSPPLFFFTKFWNICKRCCVKKDLPFSMFHVTWTQFQQWHEHGFWPNNCRLTQHLFIRESSPRTWRKWWTAIWSSLSASTYSVSTLIEKSRMVDQNTLHSIHFDFIFSSLASQRVKDHLPCYLRKSNSPRMCRDPYLGLSPLWVCSRFQKYVVFVFALSVRLPIFVMVFVFHPLIVIKVIVFSPKGRTDKSLNKDYFYTLVCIMGSPDWLK